MGIKSGGRGASAVTDDPDDSPAAKLALLVVSGGSGASGILLLVVGVSVTGSDLTLGDKGVFGCAGGGWGSEGNGVLGPGEPFAFKLAKLKAAGFGLSSDGLPKPKPAVTGLAIESEVAGVLPKSPPVAGRADPKIDVFGAAGVDAGVVEVKFAAGALFDVSSESISASLETGVSAAGDFVASPRALPKFPPKKLPLDAAEVSWVSSFADGSALKDELSLNPPDANGFVAGAPLEAPHA